MTTLDIGIAPDLSHSNSKYVDEDDELFQISDGGGSLSDRIDDVGGKFWDLASEGKLYCRSEELAIMKEAYGRVKQSKPSKTAEFILIEGDSGTGKTRLAQALQPIVEDDGGFFVMGKFDKLNRSQSHAAFIAAFSAFADCVKARGEECLEAVKENVKNLVGDESKVITDMIPALADILDTQGNAEEVGPYSEAVNRFRYVFRMFLRAISSLENPLVLVLDNLHWADEVALHLFLSLMKDTDNEGILFIATSRTGSDSPRAGIKKMLNHMNKDVICFTHIHLTNFPMESINLILANIFRTKIEESRLLASVVTRQTQGNIFFVLEFLRILYEMGYIQMTASDGDSRIWRWDATEISVEFSSTEDLIQSKISKLPQQCLEVLKVASCLGSKLDERLLTLILVHPIHDCFNYLAEKGLIVFNAHFLCYEFAHDKISEVAYSMITEDHKKRFHYRIGRQLWKCFDIKELDDFIFTVVGQLMMGSFPNDERERCAVAKLCLRAGHRAVQMSSFRSALVYIQHGISLLGRRRWRDEYELCLELYNAASEVAYSTADFETVAKLVDELLTNARNPDDTFRAQAVKVYTLGSSGHVHEAIENGLRVLKQLGEDFPRKVSTLHIKLEARKLKRMLRRRSIEALQRMPLMSDPRKLAAMQMLGLAFIYVFISDAKLAAIIGFRMVLTTIKHGLSPASCVGFALYAMVLCGVENEFEEGHRYGQLAFDLYNKFRLKSYFGRISAAYYSCIHVWKEPIETALEPMRLACRSSLESGDIEFAMMNGNILCWLQLELTPIPILEKEIRMFRKRMEFYGQQTFMAMMKPMWQSLLNLSGQASIKPTILTGEVMDESALEEMRTLQDSSYRWACFYKMFVSYYFGDYDTALQYAKKCRVLLDSPFGSVDLPTLVFYECLTQLANERKSRTYRLIIARKRISMMKKWAGRCPHNYLGKQYFMEAEVAALSGDKALSQAKYFAAIALCKEVGHLPCTALAYERAGKYLVRNGEKDQAQPYFRNAISAYEKWGAIAKIAHLKNEIRIDLDDSFS